MINSIKKWLLNSEDGNLFSFCVLIPMILLAFYLFILSPDRYVSSATVFIKEVGVAQIETGLLEGLGINASGSSTDDQLLQAFILSPNLLEKLDEELKVKEHYSESIDFIFGLSMRDAQEDFIDFFRKHVKAGIDADSGLLKIDVQAYSPQFAKLLADALLREGELFVNGIGHTIAKKEMQFAFDEINRSQSLLKEAKNRLAEFQEKNNLVGPEKEGESLVSIIFELESELAKTQAQLSQTKSFLNAKAPQISVLENKIAALSNEINSQKQRITGADTKGRLNRLGLQFQELLLDVEFSTKLYTSALNAYELSRIQAGKQLKHLIVASEPQLPEKALYPKKLYWFTTWLIFLIMLWGVVRMIIAMSREHKD